MRGKIVILLKDVQL